MTTLNLSNTNSNSCFPLTTAIHRCPMEFLPQVFHVSHIQAGPFRTLGWMALRSYLTKGRMEIFDAELWVMWIALKETAKRGETLHAQGVQNVESKRERTKKLHCQSL